MDCKSCKIEKSCDKFKCSPESKNADWAYSSVDYMSDYTAVFGGDVVTKNPKIHDKYIAKFSSRKMDSVSREARMK